MQLGRAKQCLVVRWLFMSWLHHHRRASYLATASHAPPHPTRSPTGFFLDQRDNRAFIRRLSNNKRVLNVFGYTGEARRVSACVSSCAGAR